jgi:hypothetical protein
VTDLERLWDLRRRVRWTIDGPRKRETIEYAYGPARAFTNGNEA